MSEPTCHQYTARTRYDGDMWVIWVEGLPGGDDLNVTQAMSFTNAQYTARDYVACLLEVPIKEVNVNLRIV